MSTKGLLLDWRALRSAAVTEETQTNIKRFDKKLGMCRALRHN